MGPNKIVLKIFPFKIELFHGDDLVLKANDLGRFEFEHYRQRPETMWVKPCILWLRTCIRILNCVLLTEARKKLTTGCGTNATTNTRIPNHSVLWRWRWIFHFPVPPMCTDCRLTPIIWRWNQPSTLINLCFCWSSLFLSRATSTVCEDKY